MIKTFKGHYLHHSGENISDGKISWIILENATQYL